MAAKYKSRRQYHSRLENQENKRLRKQTLFIILTTISIIALIIIVGIPLLIRMAIFIGGVGESDSDQAASDSIPPQTPQLSSPMEATNSSTLDLIGYSEPGATVSLFQNNQEKIKTVVDAGGKFEFLSIDLDDGGNSFYAVAKDSADNTSQRSLTRHVSFDVISPEITIESPENDAHIVGVTRQTITIEGNTEVGSKVMLNGRVVVVSSDGSFSTKHSLQEGENQLTITASDKAGNQSDQEINLTYSKD